MRECQITHECKEGVEIVRLEGTLDSYSFPAFSASMDHLIGRQRSLIVLDCALLDYINSASMGALIRFTRRARDNGGDLKVASLSPRVMKVVCLLGLDKMLNILPDVNQAVASYAIRGG